jgi:hypothetical protein
MSQDYNNDLSSAALSVLKERMEGNFDALATSFAGSAEPSILGAGQLFYDTDTNVLSVYNGSAFVAPFQASDATLTAIADLTFSANTFFYATGADTFNVAAVSDLAVTLFSYDDAFDWRGDLGLAIGTNVQAYDAGLQSIAALTTSSGTIPFTTALDAYSTFPSTSFGRSISNAADAAALRTLAGLGSIATQTATNVTLAGSVTRVVNTSGTIVANSIVYRSVSGASTSSIILPSAVAGTYVTVLVLLNATDDGLEIYASGDSIICPSIDASAALSVGIAAYNTSGSARYWAIEFYAPDTATWWVIGQQGVWVNPI